MFVFHMIQNQMHTFEEMHVGNNFNNLTFDLFCPFLISFNSTIEVEQTFSEC